MAVAEADPFVRGGFRTVAFARLAYRTASGARAVVAVTVFDGERL